VLSNGRIAENTSVAGSSAFRCDEKNRTLASKRSVDTTGSETLLGDIGLNFVVGKYYDWYISENTPNFQHMQHTGA